MIDKTGVLKDFLGKPIKKHDYEIPVGLPSKYNTIIYNLDLPTELIDMVIWKHSYQIHTTRRFIVVLYDKWKRIVKQWPENYEPTIEDIRKVS